MRPSRWSWAPGGDAKLYAGHSNSSAQGPKVRNFFAETVVTESGAALTESQ